MGEYIWAFPTAKPTNDGQLSITRRLVDRDTGKEVGAMTVRTVSGEIQRRMPKSKKGGGFRRWIRQDQATD